MNYKRKILVADDSATIQKVIRLALSNEDYEVLSAVNGSEAIQQIHLHRPEVVLIDITLPEKDADSVRLAIKSDPDCRNTKFVLLTSAYEKNDLSPQNKAQFEGILSKPFDPGVLRSEISKALQQSAVSSNVTFDQPPPLPPAFGRGTEAIEISEAFNRADLPPLPPYEPPQEETNAHQPHAPIDLFQTDTPPAIEAIRQHSAESIAESEIKKLTESTIRLSGLDEFEWSVHEPAAVPPPAPLAEPPKANIPLAPFPPVDTAVSKPSIESLPFTMSQIEKVIEQEVEKRIQSMAQKMVPEIAERMVRREIERLLSED